MTLITCYHTDSIAILAADTLISNPDGSLENNSKVKKVGDTLIGIFGDLDVPEQNIDLLDYVADIVQNHEINLESPKFILEKCLDLREKLDTGFYFCSIIDSFLLFNFIDCKNNQIIDLSNNKKLSGEDHWSFLDGYLHTNLNSAAFADKIGELTDLHFNGKPRPDRKELSFYNLASSYFFDQEKSRSSSKPLRYDLLPIDSINSFLKELFNYCINSTEYNSVGGTMELISLELI